MKFLLFCSLSCHILSGFAQLPLADFSSPVTGCIGENLLIQNNSSGASKFNWDFCEGDLFNSPTSISIATIAGSFNPKDMDVVNSGNEWFGFVTSRSTNSIHRINFGIDIGNPEPAVFNLGNISNLLSGPEQIKIINEAGNWFGLLINGTNSTLIRISFGPNLANDVPSAEQIFTGVSTVNSGMDYGVTAGSKVLVATNSSTNKLTLINFGNSIMNNPLTSDAITSSVITGASGLDDITLILVDGNWFGFTVGFNSRTLHRLDFGGNLFSLPIVTQVTTPSFATDERPSGVVIKRDKGSFVGFIQTFNGNLFQCDFGSLISNNVPVFSGLGNFGNLANSVNIELVKLGSKWYGFTIEQTARVVFQLSFPNLCSSANQFSTNQFPSEVSYSSPSENFISLTAFDASGYNIDYLSKSITIALLPSPDITFTPQNVCANNDVNFTSQNTSGNITDYNWDFDDTNTSIAQDPIHQFASAGDYEVKLQVTASNGCNNLATETVTIYNEPVADFDLPSASPICTNQDYLFANTTSFDVGSNPSWQWEVNGTPTSTVEDLTYQIPTATMQDIKLIATIPGCSSEVTKTINTVEDGPLTDFTFVNDCEDKSITFTNATVGVVTGYSWDFGDGNSSGLTDGTNTFDDFGTYDVTLEATNAAGCINTSIQEITIYSKPQPDFSLDLPPFSCNGSPSQFNDLTPNPVDSNLDSWVWNFGDTQNGTSTTRNPQYIYDDAGQYNVNLDVTTNFGCTASIQKIVTISQTPDASFTFNAACVNQGTSFVPQSTVGIDSWQWKVGISSYTQQNPTHVFSIPSNYNVQLTANGSNGCIGMASQTINVPVPSEVDFSFDNNCTNQDTQFTDLTNAGIDPVSSHLWQFGSIGSASGATPSFAFANAGSYPTKLTVTNQSGCSYSTTKIVNVAPSPVATFTATPQTGTPPLTVQLNNTSTNSISQLWSVSNPGSVTSTEKTTSFTFNDLGEYVVDLSIEDESGCTSISSKIISVIIPTLDIELTSLTSIPAATGESNILLTLTNKSNFPVNNIKAVVDIAGEALISETITATIQPSEVYSQILSAGIIGTRNGNDYLCVELVVDGDANTENNKQCINNDNATVVLAPYPNPASDELNLEWVAAATAAAEIHIFDPTGRKVYEHMFSDLEPGLNRVTISLGLLNPGIYYAFFVSEGVRRSFPFVIRR
ncbi:MAG: PKD domain-containing protein [Cyclobacteriaceae bacterium]